MSTERKSKCLNGFVDYLSKFKKDLETGISELPTNRVFQPTVYTPAEGLTNGVLEVKPVTRCNSAQSIRIYREQEMDRMGFHNFRPLTNEKYHYTLPHDKDGWL